MLDSRYILQNGNKNLFSLFGFLWTAQVPENSVMDKGLAETKIFFSFTLALYDFGDPIVLGRIYFTFLMKKNSYVLHKGHLDTGIKNTQCGFCRFLDYFTISFIKVPWRLKTVSRIIEKKNYFRILSADLLHTDSTLCSILGADPGFGQGGP